MNYPTPLFERKIIHPQDIMAKLNDIKKHQPLVFTNGCFDILHAGHVDLLTRARALGTKLIVGINNDESVRKIKGAPRPFVTQQARAEILAGLKAVDEVRVFDAATPENLLRQVKPDVLVKGGDYGIEGVVGADIVRAYGGDVRVLGLVENSSTTAIVEKIRSK